MDISVIIPIYNVEKYLKRCLDSVICQKNISQEIILVDDGSTDSSVHICDEYAAKHTYLILDRQLQRISELKLQLATILLLLIATTKLSLTCLV